MLKIETLNNLLGFGESGKPGEIQFSLGMTRKNNAIEEGWYIGGLANNTTIATLLNITYFAEREISSSNSTIFCTQSDGKIFQGNDAAQSFLSAHAPATVSQGQGLIVDQNNNLLYPQLRWLGMFDGTTWNDSWKDLGGILSDTSLTRPSDIFEDWVMIGGESVVIALNTLDNSINTAAFTLPAGFKIIDLASGSNGILIGVNFHGKGLLILWDGLSDRSTVPWIWLEDKVNSIAKADGQWVVSTARKFLLTNGYSIQETIDAPTGGNSWLSNVIFGPSHPAGMKYKDRRLYVGNGSGDVNLSLVGRERKGLYIYDFRTKLWEFTPGDLGDQNVRSLFFSLRNHFYLGYFSIISGVGDTYRIGLLSQGSENGKKSYFISPFIGKGNTFKKAEGIVLDLEFSRHQLFNNSEPNITVNVKLAPSDRQLWSVGQHTSTTSFSRLPVNGTNTSLNNAEIGDEVTIMQGSNAGQTRQITAITNKGMTTEYWTLDSALPHYPENNMIFVNCPLQLISSKNITSLDFKKNRLYMPVKKSVFGKHFAIKVEIVRNETETGIKAPIRVNEVSLVYDDLGTQ